MKQQARLHGEDGFARAVSAIDLAVRTAPPGRKSEYFLRSGAAAAGAKGKKHPDADVIRKLSREFDDLVCIDFAHRLETECGYTCLRPPGEFGEATRATGARAARL